MVDHTRMKLQCSDGKESVSIVRLHLPLKECIAINAEDLSGELKNGKHIVEFKEINKVIQNLKPTKRKHVRFRHPHMEPIKRAMFTRLQLLLYEEMGRTKALKI